MARFLGQYKVWYVVEDQVPPSQVDLSAVWVSSSFYGDNDVKRDDFLEICIEGEAGSKSIVVLARCLSPNIIKKGYVGLQYDNLRSLGLSIRPDEEMVKVHAVHWVRGIVPYLCRHPNPSVRYQFWLSTSLAMTGIAIGILSFSI